MKKEISLAGIDACTGCAACADVCPQECIRMEPDDEGFLYPHITSAICISCGKCMSACPVLQNSHRNDIQKLYAAQMNDWQKLLNSTSGGAFQSLAQFILEQEGIVFGAAFDNEFLLQHSKCESLEQLPSLLGSKYLQSKTEGIYKAVDQAVATGKPVLFSGTPCQCDALNRFYLSKGKALPCNLVLCEVMCHGVPSPGMFRDYVAYLQKKKKKSIATYNFRYKQLHGWEVLSQSITYTDGQKDSHKAKYDTWHCWFGNHLSVRKSCFACKYRNTRRIADITIGDFWSIKKALPELAHQNGVSAVFINTDKGQTCWDNCSELITATEIDTAQVKELFNVPIRSDSVKMPSQRADFFNCYNQGGIKALIRRFPPQNLLTAVIAKLKWMIQK